MFARGSWMASWHFSEMRPGDRAREPQIEKFFSSDVVADKTNGLIREGIQNSLDAEDPRNAGPVTIRIGVHATPGTGNPAWLKQYMDGFEPHLQAAQHRMTLAGSGGGFRYLVFEDFGTAGLRGDPEQ